MTTSAGTGGMLCGHCGRPMAAGVAIAGRMYHQECTRGPRWQPEPLAVRHYTVPMDDDRVRQIVRDELQRLGLFNHPNA